MPRYMFYLLVAVLIGLSAVAQPPRQSIDSLAAREAFTLKQKLSLSTLQQSQIEKAARRHHNSLQHLNAQRMDTAARNKILFQIQKLYRNDLQAILTPEQYKAYEELLAHQEATFMERARQKGVRVKALPKVEQQ